VKNQHLAQYVETKCQLDATEVFIVDLIAYSTCFGHHYAHHQELKSIIQVAAACGDDAGQNHIKFSSIYNHQNTLVKK